MSAREAKALPISNAHETATATATATGLSRIWPRNPPRLLQIRSFRVLCISPRNSEFWIAATLAFSIACIYANSMPTAIQNMANSNMSSYLCMYNCTYIHTYCICSSVCMYVCVELRVLTMTMILRGESSYA